LNFHFVHFLYFSVIVSDRLYHSITTLIEKIYFAFSVQQKKHCLEKKTRAEKMGFLHQLSTLKQGETNWRKVLFLKGFFYGRGARKIDQG